MIKNRGFTLVELMIVVAIIGILAAVAYPSYQNSVLKSCRVDAQANMLELTSFMERFFTENNRYDQDGGGTAVALPFSVSSCTGAAGVAGPVGSGYALSVTAATTTYTLTATPQGSQASDSCGALTINQAGAQTPNNCWR